MTWRAEDGTEGGKKVGGETRAQGTFLFKNDPESGVQITFSMVHQRKFLIFQGAKENNATTHATPAFITTDEWQRLFDPAWTDTAALGETLAQTYRPYVRHGEPYNHWKNPVPAGIIKARNKPGPNPGYVVNPGAQSTYIEECPDWAWDVTGARDVTCGELAQELDPEGTVAEALQEMGDYSAFYMDDEPEDTKKMKMVVWMDNNAKHFKADPQLWTEIRLGRLRGIARLCPSPLAKEGEVSEEPRVLKPGVWPGPRPGEHCWSFKWGGFDRTATCWRIGDGCYFFEEDGCSIELRFSASEPLKIKLHGFLMFDGSPYMFEAAKVARTRIEGGVTRRW